MSNPIEYIRKSIAAAQQANDRNAGLLFLATASADGQPSVRTLLLRRKLGVAIGDSDQTVLLRASRVHSNFAEYVPIALLLIFFLEFQETEGLWIHILCLLLLAGRIIQALGVSQVNEDYRWRTLGMALTLTVLGSAALLLLVAAIL